MNLYIEWYLTNGILTYTYSEKLVLSMSFQILTFDTNQDLD